MSYQEKKTSAMLLSGLLVFASYWIYIFQKHKAGTVDITQDIKFLASSMLAFIGIGVVTTIVIMILFHIFNAAVKEIKHEEQDDPMVEDEMDKLIALKANRNSYAIAGTGFVAALISIILQKPPAIMLNILFLGFQLGSMVEGISQLYFYRRGVHNG